METLVQAMWIIPSFDSYAPWWNGKWHFVFAIFQNISFRVKQVLQSTQIPMWFLQNQLMNSGLRWNLSKKVKLWRLLPQRVMLLVDQDSMKILFNMTLDYFKSILVRKSLIFHLSYSFFRCDGYEFHKNPKCWLVPIIWWTSQTKTRKTSQIRFRAFAKVLSVRLSHFYPFLRFRPLDQNKLNWTRTS